MMTITSFTPRTPLMRNLLQKQAGNYAHIQTTPAMAGAVPASEIAMPTTNPISRKLQDCPIKTAHNPHAAAGADRMPLESAARRPQIHLHGKDPSRDMGKSQQTEGFGDSYIRGLTPGICMD
jgi:hypothetical protein